MYFIYSWFAAEVLRYVVNIIFYVITVPLKMEIGL